MACNFPRRSAGGAPAVVSAETSPSTLTALDVFAVASACLFCAPTVESVCKAWSAWSCACGGLRRPAVAASGALAAHRRRASARALSVGSVGESTIGWLSGNRTSRAKKASSSCWSRVCATTIKRTG
eukprot:3054530-Pleurochrysis_carterae.AAC.2